MLGHGWTSILSYIITLLIFFASFLVKEPTYNDSTRNEKIKLGKRIFFASLIVNVIKVFKNNF